MPPRAIWKGAVTFGLVAIPIKLYPATSAKDIRFVSLHNTCHSRLKQRRYCEHHETYVDQSEVARGYEYSKDQYVVMEPTDFTDLPVPSTHTIEITQFVDLTSIDPVYFERSYYLEPESVGQKPFVLLNEALKNTGRVAIATVSIRQKEHICCLRTYGKGIMMSTMHYPDEIRSDDELNLPDDTSVVTKQEMSMAKMLIDHLTGPFSPEEHIDQYRVALEERIETKLVSGEPVTAAPAPVKGKVGDLMAALKDSIEATRQDEEEPAPQKRRVTTKTKATTKARKKKVAK